MQPQSPLTAGGKRADTAVTALQRRLDALRASFEEALVRPFEDAPPATTPCLAFYLNQERFAWPVNRLAEVLRRQRILPAPGVIPGILGVINYRNQTLSVTSLHDLLGLPRPDPQEAHALLITRGLTTDTALPADRLIGVIAVADADVRPKPVTLDRAAAALIAGETFSAAGMISILNPDAVSG